MTKQTIRYFAYLGYLLLAAVAWPAIAYFGFGLVPMAEPACHITHAACPAASFWSWLLKAALIFSAVPLTILGLVKLRNRLHRIQGIDGQP